MLGQFNLAGTFWVRRIAVCAVLALLLPDSGHSAAAEKFKLKYEIGRWKGFKDAAVCLTFDDNSSGQFKYGVGLLDRFGWKGTFYVVPSTVTRETSWDTLASIAARGHEVESHTWSHADLTTLDSAGIEGELERSREVLDSALPDVRHFSIAYPYARKNELVKRIVARRYSAARADGGIEDSVPHDFMAIASIGISSETTAEAIQKLTVEARAKKGLAVENYHGIQSGGWEPIPLTTFRDHLDSLHLAENGLWVESLGRVLKYIKERRSAKLDLVSVSDSELTVQLKATNLDPLVYTEPLSIGMDLPYNWFSVRITQESRTIPYSYSWNGTNGVIRFDIAPNSGPLEIQKADASPQPSVNLGAMVLPEGGEFLDSVRVRIVTTEPAIIFYWIGSGESLEEPYRLFEGSILLNHSSQFRIQILGEDGKTLINQSFEYSIGATTRCRPIRLSKIGKNASPGVFVPGWKLDGKSIGEERAESQFLQLPTKEGLPGRRP